MSFSAATLLTRRRLFWLCFIVVLLSGAHLVYLFLKDNSLVAPQVGGSYKEGIVGVVKTPNPLFAIPGSVDEDVVSLLYSGLTKYDPKQQKFVPDLATFQVSANKKEYTFFLQPGIVWHDGTPLTADDVVFTYNLIFSKDFTNPLLRKKFSDVQIVKVDDSTVKFTLPKPYIFFPSSTTLGILPKHVWESVPVDTIAQSSLNFEPIGSGPYKAQEGGIATAQKNVNAQIVSLVRNNEYYGTKPYLEKIVLEVFVNEEELLAQKDALEALIDIPTSKIPEVQSIDRFQKFTIVEPKYFGIFFNMDREQLKNWRTRLALQVAISRDDIIKEFPFLKTINTPFWGQTDTTWTNEYNLDRAKGSLFDGGWRYPDEMKVNKKIISLLNTIGTGAVLGEEDTSTGALLKNLTLSGSRLEDIVNQYKTKRYNEKEIPLKIQLVVVKSPSYLVDIAQNVKNQWEMLGVDVVLDIKDPKDIASVILNKDYDAIFLGQDLGYDQDIYQYWHSSQANKKGYNLSNFRNPNVDFLIEEMRNPAKNLTEEELDPYLKDHIAKLTAIFTQEIPAVFLFQPTSLNVVDKKFEGVFWQNLVFPSDRFETVQEWYQVKSETLRIKFTFDNFMSWLRKNI